ncbi:hypothetical protein N7509_008588 [Penicillium cosmopolitanum]|uniref:Uncharacterized protein n=1 Tax=Penicillium cosmopolitanum TaxID=1131564 RepID=A0A9X0B2U4_9EURO|nr:uncharacterized protein N7509_008588 [Penicillium cosmopolitanum]KAJ5386047.1 hypothetical protein N7509_008588 [Penicillium cosmopolitanum]
MTSIQSSDGHQQENFQQGQMKINSQPTPPRVAQVPLSLVQGSESIRMGKSRWFTVPVPPNCGPAGSTDVIGSWYPRAQAQADVK